MHLLIDVGNSETVAGVSRPGNPEPIRSWRFSTAVPRTADEFRLLLLGLLRDGSVDPGRIERAVIGSVVPAVTDRLPRALARIGRGEVYVVDATTPLPIRLDVEEPRTVGPDRIVNTLAAAHLFRRDTVVVDLGTATTFDLITGDGVFMGGVIAPGLGAGQEWLSSRTAKLPRVEFRPPAQVIGRRTETCLESGIFFAAVDAIDGIVRRILAEWGRKDVLVVATGGYASVVGTHADTVHEIAPHLTLVGLGVAGEYMANHGRSPLHSLDSVPE